MPIPKNIVLDLDDTILDFSAPAEEVWTRLYPVYAAKAGVPLKEFRRAVDESRRWYWADPDRFREGRLDLKRARRVFVRAGFEKLGLHDETLADEMADRFSRERETAIRLFDGAVDALERMRAAGARLVLLTNGESSMQRAKLARFDLAKYFRAILIEGEMGVGKPDPQAHRKALAALGAPPDQTWMAGDDLEFDVRPARALGMHTAWIRDPGKAEDGSADVIVPSLKALTDVWMKQPE
jgi:putative hydrolase of the HAD superfamily